MSHDHKVEGLLSGLSPPYDMVSLHSPEGTMKLPIDQVRILLLFVSNALQLKFKSAWTVLCSWQGYSTSAIQRREPSELLNLTNDNLQIMIHDVVCNCCVSLNSCYNHNTACNCCYIIQYGKFVFQLCTLCISYEKTNITVEKITTPKGYKPNLHTSCTLTACISCSEDLYCVETVYSCAH